MKILETQILSVIYVYPDCNVNFIMDIVYKEYGNNLEGTLAYSTVRRLILNGKLYSDNTRPKRYRLTNLGLVDFAEKQEALKRILRFTQEKLE